MSFDLNILVNGNRCKQHHYNRRTFIEAKHGSEFEIEIKNNSYKRFLVEATVDGLSVLTGKTATADDSGYVMSAYSPLRIKGFRINNDEVGAFKFTTKGQSYAKETGGSEAAQNCGVIGVKIYSEKYVPPVRPILRSRMLGGDVWGGTTKGINTGGTLGLDNDFTLSSCACDNNYNTSDDISMDWMSHECERGISAQSVNFDMGTTWGDKKTSRVTTTNFEIGNLVFEMDIFYASRSSLIAMGIPLNVETAVSFPKSFPNQYAQPPKGWIGE